MYKGYFFILSLVFTVFGMLIFSYYKEANSISETEQFYIDMLKGNIDKGNIFEGSMSFVSGDFYLNDENLLQVDDIKPVICEDLALNGYNCKDGALITKLSIDPAVTAIETLRKARASIDETEQFYIDMLKDNIDEGNIFEGSMSFVSGDFYLNDENLLQVDDIKPVICEDLALNGYNCKDGVLITKLSIDPAVTAIETLRKARASIDEVNSVINRLQQIE